LAGSLIAYQTFGRQKFAGLGTCEAGVGVQNKMLRPYRDSRPRTPAVCGALRLASVCVQVAQEGGMVARIGRGATCAVSIKGKRTAPCACPEDLARNGSHGGARSACGRPGRAAPLLTFRLLAVEIEAYHKRAGQHRPHVGPGVGEGEVEGECLSRLDHRELTSLPR
jgi:hypothetical protein